MELGKKIKQLRFKAKLTQEQLAEKLGIGAQSVSKWENSVAMPDITALPLLAEIFGVSIDELFDLTNEQRMNRIENRLDIEEDLPHDVFAEYEEFLKTQLNAAQSKKRATELTAYLYWHAMESYARKTRLFAEEAVRNAPGERGCQWMLQRAAGHAAWDWNIRNHNAAVEFYRTLTEEHPECVSPYYYLLDNLLADRRSAEAEKVLERLTALKGADPVIAEVYRAHVALARCDAPAADGIIQRLLDSHPEDSACLFEAAQYYAERCEYEKAVRYYELSFEKDPRRPRFQDALMGIAEIRRIEGDFDKAASTYGRIVDLLENEWGLKDEYELQFAKKERARLLEKAQSKK